MAWLHRAGLCQRKSPPLLIPAVGSVSHHHMGELMVEQPLETFARRYNAVGKVVGPNPYKDLVQGHCDGTPEAIILKVVEHHIDLSRIIIPQIFMKIHRIVERAQYMGCQIGVPAAKIDQLNTVGVQLGDCLGRCTIRYQKQGNQQYLSAKKSCNHPGYFSQQLMYVYARCSLYVTVY